MQTMAFYDQKEVLSVLQGFNPWWSGAPVNAPPFHRLAFHACLEFLRQGKVRRAVLLSGPRRVGKTTILTQLTAALLDQGIESKSILYLSLDHPLLKLITLPKILQLYHEEIFPVGKPAFLFLDEIHYSSEWELQLKQLVDHKPEYRILATGSASVVHHDRLAESGVGRWVKVPIPTLSFYEFVRIRGEEPPAIPQRVIPSDLFTMKSADLMALAVSLRPLMPLFSRYLLVGGFPETAKQDDIGVCQRLLREDVVERVLKRDMTMLFGVRSVDDLERLFIYLCLHSGGIFAVQTVAKELGSTTVTVANHVRLLEQANLIYRVAPDAIGGKKILKARHKVYLVDAALRNAVLLRGEAVLHDRKETGDIVETAVLRHLYAYHYRETPRITYWQEPRTKREVDIIIRTPNHNIPVEVKYREDEALTPTSGLAVYCQKEKVAQGYWVTKREEDFGLVSLPGHATSFLRIPAHIFTYLLGRAERALWQSSE
jgi:predicted AAA+ superfamily ATPase